MQGKPKKYKPIHTLDELHIHLQWALSLELSTIAPYLCALYSISDNTTMGYGLIRSVVVEEMLHMMQVANLMNATGAKISLGPDFVPQYPGFMKHHAAGGPFIQLQAFSPALSQDIFMAIEQPESSPHAPPEGNDFQTIGQFYKAIELGFEYCVDKFGPAAVFDHPSSKLQRSDVYFGSGAGHLIVVTNLAEAKLGIQEITQQGEGAEFPRPPVPGEDPFEGKDHYGMRLDGTYGPILGTPWGLSHYRKFQQLANGEVAAPPVYPMLPNPSPDRYKGETRRLAALFDNCYTLVLQKLEAAFTSPAVPVDFYGIAFPVMRFVLPQIATLLMQTPVELDADPTLGPNAGPAFAYRAKELTEIVAEAEALLKSPISSLGTAYVQTWQKSLGVATATLRRALQLTNASAAVA